MDQTILDAWADEYVRLEYLQAETASERDAYRQIACAALDQLYSTTQALTRTRAEVRRLVASLRQSRGDTHTQRAA